MPMNFDLKLWCVRIFGNKVYMLVFGLVLIITLAYALIPVTPRTVSFNIKATYAAFFKEVTARKIPQEKMFILGNRFPVALERAVKDYADKNHAIVLVSGAVMAGAKDVTPDIQRQIAKEMQRLAEGRS
jgi:conjugal transfer pilin signal peptidase TrbI